MRDRNRIPFTADVLKLGSDLKDAVSDGVC